MTLTRYELTYIHNSFHKQPEYACARYKRLITSLLEGERKCSTRFARSYPEVARIYHAILEKRRDTLLDQRDDTRQKLTYALTATKQSVSRLEDAIRTFIENAEPCQIQAFLRAKTPHAKKKASRAS